jgi:hypothetical protein
MGRGAQVFDLNQGMGHPHHPHHPYVPLQQMERSSCLSYEYLLQQEGAPPDDALAPHHLVRECTHTWVGSPYTWVLWRQGAGTAALSPDHWEGKKSQGSCVRAETVVERPWLHADRCPCVGGDVNHQ